MKAFLQIILFIFALLPNSFGQKMLQMDTDKFGGRLRFMIGDQLEFQLDNKPEWHKFTITDLDAVTQEIVFDEMRLPISRITKLFFIKKGVRTATYSLSSMIGSFGLTWTTYAVYGLIVASPMVGPVTFIVGGTALAVAGVLFVAKRIWKRKYKITPKRRLRIVDVTIYPDVASIELPDELGDTDTTRFSWFS
jgi:hypothetical protein